MKQRKLWIRRKGKSHVVEGRRGKRPILIWTISSDLTQLIEHLLKSSFFTKEKSEKIRQKLDSLNIEKNKSEKEE